MADDVKQTECGCQGGTCRATRREFLELAGAAASAYLAGRVAVAGPFVQADFEKLVPREKKLRPEWLRSLAVRGEAEVFRGAELEKIGMPIGGIGAGQLYLGGDGKLWHWDLFNLAVRTGDSHYAKPLEPRSPLDQGFAIRIHSARGSVVRSLDRRGFRDVTFRGEYPIGTVTYRDADGPIRVTLEAFSPFVPLDADDSSLPATVLCFTVANEGRDPVRVEVGGWLENAACLNAAKLRAVDRQNRVVREGTFLAVECSAHAPAEEPKRAARPEIVLEDFEKPTYEGWTVEGTAFGAGPVEKAKMPAYQGDVGAVGQRLVNSHYTRDGENVQQGDAHVGRLVSKPFTIERDYLHLLVGGGAHEGRTCVNLRVDGKVVRSVTGRNDNRMSSASMDVRALAGKEARIEIVDQEKGAWGNIGVDQIVLSDAPQQSPTALAEEPDFGTLALAILEPGDDCCATADLAAGAGEEAVFAAPTRDAQAEKRLAAAERGAPGADAVRRPAEAGQLRGGLVRAMHLAAGAKQTVTFLVAWHMPNLKLDKLQDRGRHYATRFSSATDVAGYVAKHFERLARATRAWRDTWYDSTLPYWFLDRTFANTSTLATSTCYRLAGGRFYGWEGVGCCPGTCTHVWQYAQAVSRLFPSLERDTRERVDYGLSFDPASGVIQFRGEFLHGLAIDGQAGTILRVWREHQMSSDDALLRRLWPRVRRSLECLIAKDADGDGLLDGNQHNTLDADWFGQVAWLSGMYLAALRAGEAMAREVGDEEFARRANTRAAAAAKSLVERLFNGEYFFQKGDPKHLDVVGSYDGCSIDQVLGQSWAHQVGLGAILPAAPVRSALESLWRYNFTPDVGPYREKHTAGRWYAMPGEGGMLMVTFPKGISPEFKNHPSAWSAMYFNECMSGFEHQVAAHMLWEGMIEQGLAIERMIHDRYHPARRNPWNEVECGDHYARAMASYGVFLAACGWEYHGPKGHVGFAPRWSPDNFRAAFTAAEGWGTIAQNRQEGKQAASIRVRWGRLRVRSLAFVLLPGIEAKQVRVLLDGQFVGAERSVEGGRITVRLARDVEIRAGQALQVEIV